MGACIDRDRMRLFDCVLRRVCSCGRCVSTAACCCCVGTSRRGCRTRAGGCSTGGRRDTTDASSSAPPSPPSGSTATPSSLARLHLYSPLHCRGAPSERVRIVMVMPSMRCCAAVSVACCCRVHAFRGVVDACLAAKLVRCSVVDACLISGVRWFQGSRGGAACTVGCRA